MKQGMIDTLTKILRLPLLIIKYFCVGIFITMYFILSFIITLIEYMVKGILFTLYLLKRIVYYLLYGVVTPFLYLIILFKSWYRKNEPKIQKLKEEQKAKSQKRVQEKQVMAAQKAYQREIVAQEKARQKEVAAQEKARQKELTIAAKQESAARKKEQQLQEEELRRIEEEKRRVHEEEIKKAKAFIAEEKARKREESQRAKKKFEKQSEEAYINKNVKIDKKQNSFFARLFSKKKPATTEGTTDSEENKRYSWSKKKRKELERKVLLINFEGDDAKKSDHKLLYEYVAKDAEGKVVKGYSEAFSRVEVHSYLLSEGFEVYSIKTNWWIRLMHSNAGGNRTKFKNRDLIFFLTQLSTYLKAGITLVEALRILSRQYKKKSYQSILKAVVYDLTMGDNLSDAMDKQNVAFPKLLINMIKTAEMTGELPEVLDDMVEYYSEMEQTRKQMITALTYPSLVFVFAVAVITFILVFVIPQFTEIYTSMDGVEIPKFTLIVMAVSDFLTNYAVLIFICFIVFCIIYVLLYKNVRSVRMATQWLVMHIPVIGNTVIYNEVTTLTKTLASLLSHSVFITDTMDILTKITNNEIYKMMIFDTITNLAKGEKISKAFKNHWAFPLPAYEMLVTGESTGELPEMMQKVSNYYQMLHQDSVTRLKTFIEPILTVLLTGVVGIIVLAIIVPMFGMYNSIQTY